MIGGGLRSPSAFLVNSGFALTNMTDEFAHTDIVLCTKIIEMRT